jgi:3'(2'), 5'-bisphosphate nucleotidase
MNIQDIITIAKKAGEKILDIYENEDFSKTIDFKSDDSPLTIADQAAHVIIAAALEELTPEIPVMSEEGREIPFEERKDWKKFWCVDPLDGTKEFIKKNGQFTVNIALIENGFPTLGVIYTPVTDTTYYGDSNGAFMIVGSEESPIKVNNKSDNRIAVKSASHSTAADDELLAQYKAKEAISVGSSLKFCMVACGKADIYYRHGPTMEWDTAAGQAVLEASGGTVSTLEGDRFFYNKEILRNSSFLCLGFDK